MTAYLPTDDSFFGQTVLGIDEAGRGPLAGPVVAAGVILDIINRPVARLRDSKKLTPSAREKLYHEILKQAIFVSVKEIDVATIDRINILQATLQAMKNVVDSCNMIEKVDIILIDGNRTIPGLTRPKQIAIVKGDDRINSIKAASIIAKVHRDRLMSEFHHQYPKYGFVKHKGYGTKAHIEAIFRLGPSPIHRMTFAPLKVVK